MLIAFAAAVAATPAVQEHATLHPSSAAITVQFPDLQGVFRAYPKTAGARMLADEEIQRAIGEMMAGEGADPVNPIALMMGQYNQAVAGGDVPPLLELAEGLAALSISVDVPDGDLTAAFTAGSGPEGEEWAIENFGLRLVADFADEASLDRASDVFSRLMAESTPWKTELQAMTMAVEGNGFGSDTVTAWRYELVEDEEPSWGAMERSAFLVAGGKRLALAMGNVDPSDLTAILGAGAAEAGGAEAFMEGRAAIGEARGTTVMEAHIQPFVEEMLLMQMPAAIPALDLAEGLMGPVASMMIRGGHWRVDIDGDGQFHMEGVHEPSQAGPMAGMLGAAPLEPGALSLAHPDALVTTVTSLDKNVLVNLVTELASMQDAEALAQIDEAFGFRPDRDLAAPLGGAVSYSLPQLGSLMAAPNLMIAVDLDDAEAFLRGMDGLFRMIGATSDGEVQVARDEYKKISTLYTASFPGLFGDMAGGVLPIDPSELIKPTIAVLGDRVVMTLNKSHAKKEVRRVAKLMKADAEPEVHAGIMALGDLAGATTAGHADWAAFVGGIYSQLKAFGPMLAGAGMPVDVTALPPAETMTRHFQPSRRRVRIVGDAVRHSSTSSFGPELSFLPLAMTGAVGMAVPVRVAPAEQIAVVEVEAMPEGHVHDDGPTPGFSAEEEATNNALVQVSVALTLYQIDNDGAVPSALADLVAGTKNYPDGYIEGEVPTDGWGNAFAYRADGNAYTLYSPGPNGVDDGGEGDDILGN